MEIIKIEHGWVNDDFLHERSTLKVRYRIETREFVMLVRYYHNPPSLKQVFGHEERILPEETAKAIIQGMYEPSLYINYSKIK